MNKEERVTAVWDGDYPFPYEGKQYKRGEEVSLLKAEYERYTTAEYPQERLPFKIKHSHSGSKE